MKNLDPIDLRILALLQGNGRITNSLLAEKVGLSARACLDRLHRLDASGIIDRYVAVLDTQRLGGASTFLCEITLSSHAAAAAARFERAFRSLPEVVECWLVGGQFDYLARVLCRTADHYHALTQGWIDDPALSIAKINSRVVLKTVRDFCGYDLESLQAPLEISRPIGRPKRTALPKRR